MMGGIWAALGIVCFFLLAAIRFAFLLRDINIYQMAGNSAREGICQTTGSRENQADRAQVWENSAGAVFMNKTHLYYAAAGNVRIAILRGEELIPLSRGQTMDVLAAQAYEEGKISKQEALWSMEEKRIWNYLGGDGFHEIEVCHQPIRLKQGDKVLLVSKGIFEELSWREIEDILLDTQPPQKLAERLVFEAEGKENPEKDNGSVIVIGGGRF